MSMTRWQEVALGEVLTRSRDWIELDPDADYKQITMRLWGKGAVLRGVVKGSSIAAHQQQRVKSGQFILSKIDARNGAFGLVPRELDGAVVSQDFPSFFIDEKRLLPEFLAWISKTEWFVALCRAASEGSTNRVRLKENRFLAQLVRLPPVEEQNRIAVQLDTLAGKVEKIQNLKREITIDVGNFITSAHFQASGDRIIELGEALELDEDRVEIRSGAEYPQIGIRGFGRGVFAKQAVRFGGTTYRHFNRLYDGALIVSQPKGWEGAVGVCGAEFNNWFASPEYRTFRCKPNVLRPRYLSHIIATSWFLKLLSGSTRGQGARRERLRPDMLLALRVPMPTVHTQEKMIEAFLRIDRLRTLGASEELDRLVPSMLHQAFL